ncbi:hypothetical protein CTI12_AA422590 [Artemisia annua]|uniref:Spo11/DNA topoisomerase VI subunit A N-terminal domain-containing protein n=1 Tax=Artemisia annua TaxID=35608 RepID=A0A2U1M4E6_ARTAN|nr:hypothetical protein CTI12_AA422590 [Artemisia annua]
MSGAFLKGHNIASSMIQVGSVMKLPFRLTKIQVKTADRVSTILDLLLELNQNHKTMSKRAIFYKYKELFKTQDVSDKLINDVCCLIGATRRCLGITASPKGFVIGSLVIRENGKTFDPQDTQNLGKFICPLMSDFEVVACRAKFILVVEKEAYYSSLVEDKIHKKS